MIKIGVILLLLCLSMFGPSWLVSLTGGFIQSNGLSATEVGNGPYQTVHQSDATSSLRLASWYFMTLPTSMSRTMYFVLAVLILLCVLYNALKEKFGPHLLGGRQSQNDLNVKFNVSSWFNTFRGSHSFSTKRYNGSKVTNVLKNYSLANILAGQTQINDSDPDTTEKLRLFETEVQALRGELELSQKSRLELESNLEFLDKDKLTSEERLELERVSDAIELEELKRENATTQKELERVISEKNELGREVESLQREARIAESALKDQVSLQSRLEDARMEVDALRLQMASLKREKEMAISLVNEIMSKASLGTSKRRSGVISLNAPLPHTLESSQFTDESTLLMMVGDAALALSQAHSSNAGSDDEGHVNEYASTIVENECLSSIPTDCGEGSWLKKRSLSVSSSVEERCINCIEYEEEVDEGDAELEVNSDDQLLSGNEHPLTNSTLFRRFLQTNFS